MLIAGAKGFAKQMLEVIDALQLKEEICFFDDYDASLTRFFEYQVLKNEAELLHFFQQHGNSFSLGVGNPKTRFLVYKKLADMGGKLVSLISPRAQVARYASLENGVSVLTDVIVENSATVGDGSLLNLKACICHDCTIGRFVEISPGALITGGCSIGDFSFIGAGAVLKPQVKIGKNVVIGAGAVVVHDIPDNTTAVGVPAKVIKTRIPLEF